METTKKIRDISLGQEDYKIMARLARLWNSKNKRSRTANSLISVNGLLIDEDVSVFLIKISSSYQNFKLKYFHLSICFYDRGLWYRPQFQKNLRRYSDLYLMKVKNLYVCSQI
jgi:hypothetical protein